MSELASFFSKMPDSKQLGLHWSYSFVMPRLREPEAHLALPSLSSPPAAAPKALCSRRRSSRIKENSICIALYRVRQKLPLYLLSHCHLCGLFYYRSPAWPAQINSAQHWRPRRIHLLLFPKSMPSYANLPGFTSLVFTCHFKSLYYANCQILNDFQFAHPLL